MSLSRGGNPPSPTPSLRQTVQAQARGQTAAALWPHASRASLVLLGGAALLVAHIVFDPSYAALKRVPITAFNQGGGVSNADAGAAGHELLSLGSQIVGIIALALFASISQETGTLALLILLALWLGYLWLGTTSPLNQKAAPPPSPAGQTIAGALQQATAQIQQQQQQQKKG